MERDEASEIELFADRLAEWCNTWAKPIKPMTRDDIHLRMVGELGWVIGAEVHFALVRKPHPTGSGEKEK
jgi:hypothetical protein